MNLRILFLIGCALFFVCQVGGENDSNEPVVKKCAGVDEYVSEFIFQPSVAN